MYSLHNQRILITPYFDYVKAAYRLNCDKFLFLFFELYKCECLIVQFVSFFQMAILRKEDDSNHEDDPKIEDKLKNDDTSKKEDITKNEDHLNTKDNLKNEDDPKMKKNLKIKITPRTKTTLK